ncbi:hypothetical protein CASFOL_030754 [Castilleja foliolosa]|uniref:Uncharacterized protein n=1 Tax=Castilleja foliolosa TaxID=1961234 RepID=A0ABD3C905_9LAMI
MSIAFERSNSTGGDHRTERPGFAYRNMACASSIYNPQELSSVDQRFSAVQQPALEDQRELFVYSTSGVGRDLEEVQSECKGGPLDSLEALEEVLPVKKSISNFYRGKSKSFTSLSDAAHSSVKDITKPENAYTRQRKNLLTFNNIFDKSPNNILRSCKGGISKRSSTSRSMLALASTMNCSDSPSIGCSLPPSRHMQEE